MPNRGTLGAWMVAAAAIIAVILALLPDHHLPWFEADAALGFVGVLVGGWPS